MRRFLLSLAALALVTAGFALTPANGASAGGPEPKVLFVGDSMGKQLATTMQLYPQFSGYTAIDRTKGACTLSRGILLGYNRNLYGGPGTNCADWPNEFASYRDDPTIDADVIVLVVGGWDRIDRWGKSLPVACSPGPWCPAPKFRITEQKGDDRFLKSIERAVEVLHATGIPVIVATQPYSNPKLPNQGTPKNAYWEPYSLTPPGPTAKWPKGWRSPMRGATYISGRTKSDRIVQLVHQAKNTTFAGDPEIHVFDMHPILDLGGEFTGKICPWPGPLDPPGCASSARVKSRLADGAHLSQDAQLYVLDPLTDRVDAIVP
jgi:hypothetical protein